MLDAALRVALLSSPGRLACTSEDTVAKGDEALRDFFASNLPEEEKHVNWLETELSFIDEVGDANYLAQQSTSRRELPGDARASGPRSHKGFRTVSVETRLPAQATRRNVGRSTRP